VRLLGRYVFREILTSSVLGTLLATFVIFLHGADALLKLLVGSNPGLKTILTLLALAMPPVLPLTIPFGVLVGILIGLGRMASDGEIVAMRAAGVSSRKVIAPVMMFALLGAGLAAWASLRLTPYSFNQTTRIVNQLAANQVTADIQARVFNEDFPNTILYVDDVRPSAPGSPVRWNHVFLADVTKPEERKKGLADKADGPLITVARQAVAVSDPKNSRIELELHDYANHEMGKDLISQDFSAPLTKQVLQGKPPEQPARKPRVMSTRELLRYRKQLVAGSSDAIESSVELHQRFAYPVACLMLALVGIPLGIATRKGGKSAAYVIAVFLGFFCYWLSSLALVNVAKQRTLPVPLAIWLPDAAFGIAGIIALSRTERPGERDLLGAFSRIFNRLFAFMQPKTVKGTERSRLANLRIPLLPQIVDTYILSNFIFYLAVILAAFVSMILVYNFFELTGDMIKNNIGLATMGKYLFFLTPELIYRVLPICVLVAVLVNFGVLSKQNEVTAFKACGVSLYRMALPVLIFSALLSGGLFAFNYYYVPGANLKQDKLRDIIKNRPKQTYYRPDRKWIMGRDFHIYYYRIFEPVQKTMGDVSVYELQANSFQVLRQIKAEQARWNASAGTWTYENGWRTDFSSETHRTRVDFQAATFPELTEPPDYFLKENLLYTQMNFRQLEAYIGDLRQSGYGYDTVKLEVQFHRKFSVPLFALIMALIAVPFGFLVGNRGAMTGIGVSIGIALSYWGVSSLFEKIGEVNQLPPAMAAWAPDVVFGLAGMYFLLRMRS
jgi:LPS export ABC transporter permease LptG/LPS export ABC transporter permease LptF